MTSHRFDRKPDVDAIAPMTGLLSLLRARHPDGFYSS
jgi:hypothetical protein